MDQGSVGNAIKVPHRLNMKMTFGSLDNKEVKLRGFMPNVNNIISTLNVISKLI